MQLGNEAIWQRGAMLGDESRRRSAWDQKLEHGRAKTETTGGAMKEEPGGERKDPRERDTAMQERTFSTASMRGLGHESEHLQLGAS